MSNAYCVKNNVIGEPTTTPEMRIHSQRPGKRNPDGTVKYFTEQNHKRECDINMIIKKYDKTGLIIHTSKMEAKYGDMTGIDFTNMQNKVIEIENNFQKFPVEIRNRFQNSPAKFLEFMEDPQNRDEAIKLGLIKKHWTPETDGLGEHVLEGEHVRKEKKKDGSEVKE